MKKSLIFILVSGFAIYSFCQESNFSQAFIGDSLKQEMTISEILGIGRLNVIYCGLDQSEFTVCRFFVYREERGIDRFIPSDSSQLSAEQIDHIKKAHGNEIIYFHEIKIKPKGTDSLISINPFKIKVRAPKTYAVVDLKRRYTIEGYNDIGIESFENALEIDSIVVSDSSYFNNKFRTSYEVLSFDFSTTNFYRHIEGNKISHEIKNKIRDLKKYKFSKCHKIEIFNVRYRDAKGDIFYATPIKFKMVALKRKKRERLELKEGFYWWN